MSKRQRGYHHTYRGGKNMDIKRMTSGINAGIGNKAYGRPTPLKLRLERLQTPMSSEPVVVVPADPEKVAAWRASKDNKKAALQDLEDYKRYRSKWEAAGKKYPLLPFLKWRAGRNGEDA